LRQGQAGCLDQYVVDPGAARKDLVERGDEVIGHRAADAAIGEFDDILLRAGFDGTALEDVAIHSDIAELVDNERKALVLDILEDVADQRGLAGTQETGDDGTGNARGGGGHGRSFNWSRLGMRATRPRLRELGRSRHGIIPSADRARSSAPATRSGPSLIESPPKT